MTLEEDIESIRKMARFMEAARPHGEHVTITVNRTFPVFLHRLAAVLENNALSTAELEQLYLDRMYYIAAQGDRLSDDKLAAKLHGLIQAEKMAGR